MALLVEALVQAIEPFSNLPFAFFGHSFGALISFELARYLQRQQAVGPQQLFIAGCPAPQIPNTEQHIHHLPDSILLNTLRQLRGTPEAVLQNAELMQLLLPMFRADFTLYETYQYVPGAPLSCPISAFGGLDDMKATSETLDPWRIHTQKSFTLSVLPGDHFFLLRSRTILLQIIAQDILLLQTQKKMPGNQISQEARQGN